MGHPKAWKSPHQRTGPTGKESWRAGRKRAVVWACELGLDIRGRGALGGDWREARKALDGEEVTALPRSRLTLPQYSLYLADTGPRRVSAPNPGDGWVKVKAGLRPLGGGGPGVSMAPFFTSCLTGGLDHWGLWVCGREQHGFQTASLRVSSLVLRPERNFSREPGPEQPLFHNILCGPEEAVGEVPEGSRPWVGQPTQEHSFPFRIHGGCSATSVEWMGG